MTTAAAEPRTTDGRTPQEHQEVRTSFPAKLWEMIRHPKHQAQEGRPSGFIAIITSAIMAGGIIAAAGFFRRRRGGSRIRRFFNR